MATKKSVEDITKKFEKDLKTFTDEQLQSIVNQLDSAMAENDRSLRVKKVLEIAKKAWELLA